MSDILMQRQGIQVGTYAGPYRKRMIQITSPTGYVQVDPDIFAEMVRAVASEFGWDVICGSARASGEPPQGE